MTAAYVAVVHVQREAAQVRVMASIVEQKLAALANREDVRATSLMEQVAHHVREARHHALNAASVLDTILSESEKVPS